MELIELCNSVKVRVTSRVSVYAPKKTRGTNVEEEEEELRHGELSEICSGD